MKFGKTLPKEVIQEWAKKYIDYNKLKTLLKFHNYENDIDPDFSLHEVLCCAVWQFTA